MAVRVIDGCEGRLGTLAEEYVEYVYIMYMELCSGVLSSES